MNRGRGPWTLCPPLPMDPLPSPPPLFANSALLCVCDKHAPVKAKRGRPSKSYTKNSLGKNKLHQIQKMI